MKTIYIFLLMTCMTIVSWAQSPGILGRRNLWMISTATGLNENFKPSTAPFVTWERLRSRHLTYGFEIEHNRIKQSYRQVDPDTYQNTEGVLTTSIWGGGAFVKNYFFKGRNILPPMGPYFRYDFMMHGATSSFKPNPSRYVSDSSSVVLDRVLYPSFSISFGSSMMIKMRVILDLGLRFRVSSPLPIGLMNRGVSYSPGKTVVSDNFASEIFKIYVGIGFLQ